MKNAFEEAYSEKTGEIISLDEIKTLFESNTERYYNEIQPYLYCPECEEAHLIYVNRFPSAYLKAEHVNEHAYNCPMKYEPLSNETLCKKSSDMSKKETEKVNNKLTNLLNQIYIQKEISQNINHNFSLVNTEVKSGTDKKSTTTYKRVPRKSINLPFSSEDDGAYKMYYGEVYIVQEEDIYNRLRLQLYNKDRKKLCYISASEAVKSNFTGLYPHLNENEFVKIAVFGEYNKKYNKISIKHSMHIKIIK